MGDVSCGDSDDKIIQSKTFTESYPIKEDIRQEARIEIAQEPFYLVEADFIRLKHDRPAIFIWAERLLIASLGYGLSLIGKVVSGLVTGQTPEIKIWELITFLAALFIGLITIIIGHFLPNERKNVINDIQNHFRSAPRSRKLLKDQK